MASGSRKPVAKWIDAGNGWIPQNAHAQAIIGGYDITGEHLYIGRAVHETDLLPGKINRSHGCCYVPFEGREIAKRNYQVLAQLTDSDAEFEWLNDRDGSVPRTALQAGVNKNKERYYIGRAKHQHHGRKALTVGYISPSQGALFIAFAGSQERFVSYEVLCVKQKD